MTAEPDPSVVRLYRPTGPKELALAGESSNFPVTVAVVWSQQIRSRLGEQDPEDADHQGEVAEYECKERNSFILRLTAGCGIQRKVSKQDTQRGRDEQRADQRNDRHPVFLGACQVGRQVGTLGRPSSR